MIGLRLPVEIGTYLSTIAVPGTPVNFGHAHVTITYLGEDTAIDCVLSVIQACFDIAQQVCPFTCTLDHVKSFPKGAEGFPIICPVTSPTLHNLKHCVDKALDQVSVPYSKKFPEYCPHTTLSYSDVSIPATSFPSLRWVAYDLVVWGGGMQDQSLVTTIPLHFDSAAVKVAHRFKTKAQ